MKNVKLKIQEITREYKLQKIHPFRIQKKKYTSNLTKRFLPFFEILLFMV